MSIYKSLISSTSKARKQFALLIDPDKTNISRLKQTVKLSNESGVDFFFVGGSFLTNDSFSACIRYIKDNSAIPVIIFPGSCLQISENADAILFLSLISGRNPDLLIGNHVIAAPYLKKSSLEIIPTGYMLIESGNLTTATYISNTMPLPAGKPDIAAYTAIAGEMLGLRLIYLDAGSGADKPVPEAIIQSVKQNISLPLIVGGGIRTPQQAKLACDAGADVIVIGNALEKEPNLINKLSDIIHRY